MTHHKNNRFFILVLICVAVLFSACDNSPPAPQNPPFFPGCSESNLIGHINQANSTAGPDVINLYPNCVYTLTQVDNSVMVGSTKVYNGLPAITSEITIQGNNATIEIQKDPGEPRFGHFYVDPSGDLELYDLTLKNGLRQLGGAVIVFEGDFFASSTYFVENGVGPMDMNNIIPGRGGAIYNESGRVRIINNSIFLRNYASQPSSQGGDLGGAIYSKNGVLTVYSSTFDANSSNGSGGAIYAEKDLSDTSGGLVIIDDSYFISNRAVRDGGAISLINEANGVIITRSAFSFNQADGSGGAIFSEASDLTASFGTFEINTAALGGAIFSKRPAEGDLSSLTSKRSTYNHNTASEIGGAIFSENSDLEIEDSNFNDNTANSCGAIRNGGSPSLDIIAGDLETAPRITSSTQIIDGMISRNAALQSHGGAICHVMGDLSIQGTLFTENQAVSMGGALLLLDTNQLSGIYASGNTAERGGGIAIGYPENYTPNSTWGLVNITVNTTITGSTFNYNQAIFRGGGIWSDHYGPTSISNSTFAGNASHFGGGMSKYRGDLYIANSTFSGNTAWRGGGLMAMGSSDVDITHTTFSNNMATEPDDTEVNFYSNWGGGAVNLEGRASVENSLFVDNLPVNCQLRNGMNYSHSGVYSTDNTCGGTVETNPMIGLLLLNGGGTATHSLLPGSPLIDVLSGCAGVTEDQRGITRPQGANCDPGSYEFDPNDPPEPPLPPPLPGDPPDDSSSNCDPFENMDISVLVLNVPADTLVLPLYFRFPVDLPAQPEFRALLGEFESDNCGLQGFPDRLYCMFSLPPEALGLALDLKLFVGDCVDPAYLQSGVSIPLPKCNADLGEAACKVAGGTMSSSRTTAPYCICP